MANVKKLIPFIRKWEGGYVNDPADMGGPTNMGVTIETYRSFCKSKCLPEPGIAELKKITEAEWEEIFKTLYWDRWQADKILSQSLADILVDWVWGSGKWGIIIPQRVLGITQDGIVGPKTIEAVNSADPRQLFDKIFQARVKYIDDICKSKPTNEKFRKGWMNRLNDMKYEE